jgi:hypothetical protein
MPATGLKDWTDIKLRFTDCLLLGNGASIAVHQSFDYRKLLAKATANHLITGRVKTAFDHFNTTDFEYVLNMLWHTYNLNKALGVKETKTRTAYRKVREALVKAIELVHPEHSEVLPRLGPLSDFLRHFDTILSLNYDLILYWARMRGQELDPTVSFKDGFVRRGFDPDWQGFDPDWRRLRQPIRTAKHSTLVFYPHGNIALAADLAGNEGKVRVSTAANLLEQIQQAWESEDCVPVFVSEGQSEQKLSAIHRSSYLATVYKDVLSDVGVSLVVYGWSFRDEDDHILDALSRGRLKRIAVSIYTPDREWRTTRERVRAKVKKAFSAKTRPEVLFFDSASVPLAAAS